MFHCEEDLDTLMVPANRNLLPPAEVKTPPAKLPALVPLQTEQYVMGEKLGQGAYAVVYQALDKVGQRQVAIKSFIPGHDSEGIAPSALREMAMLRALHHVPQVVSLLDIQLQGDRMHAVLDLAHMDLNQCIRERDQPFPESYVRRWMRQLLTGLQACHRCRIIHRDIKPHNLLLDGEYNLTLADFGMARVAKGTGEHTPCVVTLWYRAPEVILGGRYGYPVDLWAAGCILAELLLRAPFLMGRTNMDQLNRQCARLGTPDADAWPELPALLKKNPLMEKMPPGRWSGAPWTAHLLGVAPNTPLDNLLKGLLCFNPARRWTATEALASAYFQTED